MRTIVLENKRGFTLIELVIVIVLIGILAATALPKFANLTTQARTASNQGVGGGFAAAVSVVHAAWIAQGAPAAFGTISATGELNGVNFNANGWPDGGAQTTGTIASSVAGCMLVWTAILNNPPSLSTVYASAPSGSGATSTCTYTAVSGTGVIAYNLSTGAVTITP